MLPVRMIAAAAVALLVSAGAAQAQPSQAKTVSACGTPGNTPVVGNSYPLTMDQTGKLCTDGTGGGGTLTVTATAAAPTYVEGSDDNPISSDLHGSQRVTVLDAAGAAVDWTAAVPVTQSGTWTVQPGNTANTTPWLVTGSGTAGTAASGVLSVQGIASMTPVQVSQATATNLNATVVGTTADDAAASGNPVQVAGKYTATAPTFTDGDTAQLRVTAKGNLIVGGGTADDAAAPASADSFPVPVGGKYNATFPTYTDGDRTQLQFTSRGQLGVTLYNNSGTVISAAAGADGATIASTGIRVNSLPVISNGTTADVIRSIAGSFGSATGVQAVEQAGSSFAYIGTATTTQVKSGAGILHKVTVNTCVASATIDLIDNTSGSTINIGRITCPGTVVNPFTLTYDLGFATGLRIITSGATDLTVSYR